mmetsp:Transcript_16592/g.28248  ORF Transcript_16592/g.28248 Transcript_16592/m.28248 type:complete len:187 (+) Transcript_16592:227-787(+)
MILPPPAGKPAKLAQLSNNLSQVSSASQNSEQVGLSQLLPHINLVQTQFQSQAKGKDQIMIEASDKQKEDSSAQTSQQLEIDSDAQLETISQAEIQASQDIDNMSISEIIQQRFKKNLHVQQVKTPQEVADLIIKGPEDANLMQNVEGEQTEQQEYQQKIADIETNRMYAWSDINKVKKDLWNKLH